MWYAIAAIVALVVGGVAWAVVRSGGSGRAKAERDQLRESQERQDEASEILAEPAPTGWRDILARRAARRQRRLRDGGAG